ncbi:MAG: hotdog domain-containing protein [Bacteroidales bacterium]|nr:hotdog domain-containing protein [Bacteroidales bacterium]
MISNKKLSVRKTVEENNLNTNKALFGGELLKWMDFLAYEFSAQIIGKSAVTVKIREVNFLQSAKLGDQLELVATVLKVRGASIEIKIVSNIIGKLQNSEHSNAIFVMAAVDTNGKLVRLC